VRRLGKNERGGRDFVVGDIHGAYSTLYSALHAVDFDPERDRLFLVGDLIDRGPDSWMCAELLAQDWVVAIRGNHEDMLIELYQDGEPDPAVLEFMVRRNGFGWWLETTPARRQAVLDAVRKLPLVVELETGRGLVGFVHGDVPAGMDWPTFVAHIEAADPDVQKVALWGRERVAARDEHGHRVNGGVPNQDGVAGIGRVFVGHCPQWDGLTRLGNVYAVDTGAIYGELGLKAGGRLTLAEVACQTQVLSAPRRPALIDIRADLEGEGTDRPFGNYVKGQNDSNVDQGDASRHSASLRNWLQRTFGAGDTSAN
jgi:serine/threonine protein phosphatase 1